MIVLEGSRSWFCCRERELDRDPPNVGVLAQKSCHHCDAGYAGFEAATKQICAVCASKYELTNSIFLCAQVPTFLTFIHLGVDDFVASHIPTSVFFNIDAIADNTSTFPHMLPSSNTFSQAMTSLGIQRNDTIVVYDSSETGIFSAPRVAWTLKAFRHPTVHILNNYKEWVRAGFPVTSGPMKGEDMKSREVYPEVEVDADVVASFEEVVKLAQGEEKGKVQIVDARPNGRFSGVDPEPREGLSSGHVPGAINLPFFELLDDSRKLRDPAALKEVLLAKVWNSDHCLYLKWLTDRVFVGNQPRSKC